MTRLLIYSVEDVANLTSALTSAGLDVFECKTEPSFIQALLEQEFDVVVLPMPTGCELAYTFRQYPNLSLQRLLFMADLGSTDEELATVLAAEAVLPLPFSLERWMAEIETVLSRPPRPHLAQPERILAGMHALAQTRRDTAALVGMSSVFPRLYSVMQHLKEDIRTYVHDARVPLTSINGYINLLLVMYQRMPSPQAADLIADLKEAVTVLHLISQTLDNLSFSAKAVTVGQTRKLRAMPLAQILSRLRTDTEQENHRMTPASQPLELLEVDDDLIVTLLNTLLFVIRTCGHAPVNISANGTYCEIHTVFSDPETWLEVSNPHTTEDPAHPLVSLAVDFQSCRLVLKSLSIAEKITYVDGHLTISLDFSLLVQRPNAFRDLLAQIIQTPRGLTLPPPNRAIPIADLIERRCQPIIRGAKIIAEASVRWIEQPAIRQNAQFENMVSVVLNSARFLLNLTDKYLIGLKYDSQSVTLEPLDLLPIVTAVLEQFQVSRQSQPVSVSVSAEDNLPPVLGDLVGITQIFTNLIDNAIKYMTLLPDDRQRTLKLTFTCSPTERRIWVHIADTGPGIEEQALSRLFEKWFRADNARDSGIKGSGLGLYIVKTVLDCMDGEIHVTSGVGTGTTFRVGFRIAESENDA